MCCLIAIERVQDALVLAMEAAIRKGLKNVFLSRLMRRILTSFLPTTRLTCFILTTYCVLKTIMLRYL